MKLTVTILMEIMLMERVTLAQTVVVCTGNVDMIAFPCASQIWFIVLGNVMQVW